MIHGTDRDVSAGSPGQGEGKRILTAPNKKEEVSTMIPVRTELVAGMLQLGSLWSAREQRRVIVDRKKSLAGNTAKGDSLFTVRPCFDLTVRVRRMSMCLCRFHLHQIPMELALQRHPTVHLK